MTAGEVPLCDCPEPCACYAEGHAAGKDKAFFEVRMVLQEGNHAVGCGCDPCLVIRAVREEALASVPQGTPFP